MKRYRFATRGLVASLHVTPILLGALVALAAVQAHAHALVVSSQPAANATVARGALHIELRFNSRIDAKRSRVVLVAPDRSQRDVATVSDASGALLTGTAEVERVGSWSLRWQVLSLDGHVTRGDIPFAVENR